ncbi:MAG TPA: CopD family protein [Hyphomonadaceae bacterium]|nr:CopD family protein [Hyphomonadaceae bacterium]
MTGDGLALLQLADRIGLNLFALLTIGFALHAASGVVERDSFRGLRPRIALTGAAVVLFTAARLGILVAQMGDGGNFLDPELMPLAWLVLGDSTLAILVGAVASIAGMWFGSRVVAGLGAAALSVGFGLTGHAQGLTAGLAPIMVAAHVLIAGFWVAAPISLYPGPTLDSARLTSRLHRFSTIAVAAIPVLIALGIWLAWILTEGGEKLLVTTYGLLLLAKLAIGVIAIGVGALNKQVITAKVAADPATGKKWLRVALLCEATLFAAAIIAVSAATTIGAPAG